MWAVSGWSSLNQIDSVYMIWYMFNAKKLKLQVAGKRKYKVKDFILMIK